MQHRFNRSHSSAVSFFAFQDVITGTTGFLIIITIFLALSVDDVIDVIHHDAPSQAIANELKKTLERISDLKPKVVSSSLLPGENRETLSRMIADLKLSIERLSPPSNINPKGMSIEESTLSREVRIEAQKLLTKMEHLKKKLPDSSQETAQAESKVSSLESEVKSAQDRLQQTLDQKNILKLIPDRSQTNKEPVLIVVQKNQLRVQVFGSATPTILSTNDELLEALRAYPNTSHYAVLYFKPSGALRFFNLTKAIRQAGYEIGYDLISEEIELDTRKGAK